MTTPTYCITAMAGQQEENEKNRRTEGLALLHPVVGHFSLVISVTGLSRGSFIDLGKDSVNPWKSLPASFSRTRMRNPIVFTCKPPQTRRGIVDWKGSARSNPELMETARSFLRSLVLS